MMLRRPFSLALCLSASLLASCSFFGSSGEDKKEDAKTEQKNPEPAKIDPLPGGDPMYPVNYREDLPQGYSTYQENPYIREPDITSSLPLNMDGSPAGAPPAAEAPATTNAPANSAPVPVPAETPVSPSGDLPPAL